MNQNERLLTLREVIAITTLSKPSIYKHMHAGEFPKQIRVGTNRVAWIQREIHEWIEAQAAARQT